MGQTLETIEFEPALHRSSALHSHSSFLPTALEDHSRGVRNAAHKAETCEFDICRANREVSKARALVVASALWTGE